MLSKREIKDIQSLSHKKLREELKLFVAEGPKIVLELLQLIPSQIERLYATHDWIKSNPALADRPGMVAVTDAELERISQLQTPNSIVAVIRQFESRDPEGVFFSIYLDTIQDPGNFGTIIRIADWFGIGNLVCTEGCADLYNPKVVQASMASMARVNVYYDKEGDWLAKQKLPVYAATLEGRSLYDQGKTDRGILVIGNESRGIGPSILSLATERITIPKKGHAESLNAAVATGIILSHLLN
jgi:TrmH family RNA methyltransferase